MKSKARHLIAGGLLLTNLAGAASALANEAAAPIWRTHLPADYLQPVTLHSVPTAAAAASATLWRAYLPAGRVGSPRVSRYAEQQVRNRIPWSSQTSAASGEHERTLTGVVR